MDRQTKAGAPAGYSGTPLHRKLGVKPGHRVLTVGAPPGFPPELLDADGAAALELVDDLPGRVAAHDPAHVPAADPAADPAPDPADVLLLFCPDAATMAAWLPTALELTAAHGRCWVAWPKKASKVPTDLTEDVVRAAALAVGWVDVKVCAVDGVWSGLCLMRRAAPLRSSS